MIMKKLFIVLLFLSTAFLSRSQNISIGVTGGFGHAWSNLETSADKRFHPAYNLGAKIVYSFQSHWGVSGDLKYSGEGSTYGADGDNKTVVRANYIRVPLQGIYFFGEYGDRIRPKISLGPSFGFFVGGNTRTISGGEEISKIK